MADDKRGRDKQADDVERRQQERDIDEELERGGEVEPPVESVQLEGLESDLESLSFPATGADVVAAVGDRELESTEGTYTVAELVPNTDAEVFDAPRAVRMRIQRPTVAAAMKRVVEANATLPNAEFRESQREAYEKTFRALKAIDADDDDEGITAIADWVVERIRDKQKLPGSRDVRRQAAKFCRKNGYTVSNNDWLGI